jgi:hypothetical protein
LEEEEILLEKIVSYAMPKQQLHQKDSKKHPLALDSIY